MQPPRTFAEFWPIYLSMHKNPRTRWAHYIGTAAGSLLLAAGAVTLDWRLIAAAPIAGYAPAMLSHPLIEGNRPATFGHPLWSFRADFLMLWRALTGRL